MARAEKNAVVCDRDFPGRQSDLVESASKSSNSSAPETALVPRVGVSSVRTADEVEAAGEMPPSVSRCDEGSVDAACGGEINYDEINTLIDDDDECSGGDDDSDDDDDHHDDYDDEQEEEEEEEDEEEEEEEV